MTSVREWEGSGQFTNPARKASALMPGMDRRDDVNTRCLQDISKIESPESGEQGAGQVRPESIYPRPGWAELRRQLEYKLDWNGGRLIAVPAIHTSRTCPECGYEANADLVAAISVERAGLARIACEVNDGVSRQQQEPPSVAAQPATPGIPLLHVSFTWGWTSTHFKVHSSTSQNSLPGRRGLCDDQAGWRRLSRSWSRRDRRRSIRGRRTRGGWSHAHISEFKARILEGSANAA